MKIEKKTPLHKALSGNVKILPGDERTVVAIITNTSVDREGDVVVAQGVNLKDFEANPVVMYGHDYDIPPVGKVVGVERDASEIRAKIQFAERPKDYPDDEEWLPETLFSLYQQGVMNAFSIGFIPTKFRAADNRDLKTYGDDCRQVISNSKLLELSCVPLPCNQDAVAVAVSKGLMSQAMADKLIRKDTPAVMPEPMNGGGQAVHDEMGTCVKCEKQFPMGDLTQTTDDGGEGPYLMCVSCRNAMKKETDKSAVKSAGDGRGEESPPTKELNIEVSPRRRMLSILDPAVPAPETVRVAHFVIEPEEDVRRETRKIVINEISKSRGRIWLDD